MKNLKFTFLFWLGAGLVSCSLNPAWIFNSSPTDWDEIRERRPDTPKNRAYYFDWYSRLIEQEAAGEGVLWETSWKGIFEGLDQGNDAAKLYQTFIIQERRKRGLPELNFL